MKQSCTKTPRLVSRSLNQGQQDTAVALQALAQYGYTTFSKESLNAVKVNFMESPSKTFQMNNKNCFLLQQASLPTLPGNYSVEVNGTGCVYLQIQYQNSVVGHADINKHYILFYLHEVSQTEITSSSSVEHSLPISDIKPVSEYIF